MQSVLLYLTIIMLSFSRGMFLATSGSGFGRSPLKSSFRRTLSNASAAPVLNPTLNFTLTATNDWSGKGDMLVIPFFKHPNNIKGETEIAAALKAAIPTQLSTETKTVVSSLLDDGLFKGEVGTTHFSRIAGDRPKYIALLGLGSDLSANPSSPKSDQLVQVTNKAGKALSRLIKASKLSSVDLVTPSVLNAAGLTQILLALHDELYVDNRFKKVPEGGHPPQTFGNLNLLGCPQDLSDSVERVQSHSRAVASGVSLAKDLVGAPPNYLTPLDMAAVARSLASEHGLDCTILDEEECRALGMGGFLGVQAGSQYPARFVHLVYRPPPSPSPSPSPPAVTSRVALVGKGLTFDSGGYNLKTGAGSQIELMKFDMGGAAAVLGAARAVSALSPRGLEVHFLAALCENMVSAHAMRPGDVLVTSNGKTVEVVNTDAEGRLTLADALVYAERLRVDAIVDVATLTGACVAGLGEKVAGLFASQPPLLAALQAAAAASLEAVWPLPLDVGGYRQALRSPVADLRNIAGGGKGGGAITAALFLREFVEKTPWAHIDMAGPVWNSKTNKPTGFGVKLLVNYLLHLSDQAAEASPTPDEAPVSKK